MDMCMCDYKLKRIVKCPNCGKPIKMEINRMPVPDYGDKVDIEETLSHRQAQYGDFEKKADIISEVLEVFKDHNYSLMHPVYKEAIHMIIHKLARAVVGNEDIADTWRDIAGYATLAERQAEKYTVKIKQQRSDSFKELTQEEMDHIHATKQS